MTRLLREDHSATARFTTVLDLYALPAEFPGWPEARKKALPLERVQTLEAALQRHIDDWRFTPYIQLHEFETLLYCDLNALAQRISGVERALKKLAQEVAHLMPEAINEGETTAPSKRLIRHVPIYEKSKVRVGASAAAAIGLPVLRQKCPHFAAWLTRLEALQGEAE